MTSPKKVEEIGSLKTAKTPHSSHVKTEPIGIPQQDAIDESTYTSGADPEEAGEYTENVSPFLFTSYILF
jgi:hypothetical protein